MLISSPFPCWNGRSELQSWNGKLTNDKRTRQKLAWVFQISSTWRKGEGIVHCYSKVVRRDWRWDRRVVQGDHEILEWRWITCDEQRFSFARILLMMIFWWDGPLVVSKLCVAPYRVFPIKMYIHAWISLKSFTGILENLTENTVGFQCFKMILLPKVISHRIPTVAMFCDYWALLPSTGFSDVWHFEQRLPPKS